MAVGIAVVVIVAVIVGVVVAMRSRARAAERDGEGANEILQSPPTSFPSGPVIPPTPALPSTPVAPAIEAAKPAPAKPAPTAGAPAPAPAAPTPAASQPAAPAAPVVREPATPAAEASPSVDGEREDEIAAARFRAPGSRAVAPAESAHKAPAPPRYPLEPVAPVELASAPAPEPKAAPAPPPELAPEPTPTAAVAEPPSEATSEPAPGSEPEATPEPVAADEPDPFVLPEPVTTPTLSLVGDAPVIDLDAVESAASAADAQESAWQAITLEPEPDAVDHVLQALINRARFKQVGVEEVATELVERADLRGEEVSDVLAELVGRADDSDLDPVRSSELVLFNDEVPSRPGQLTDFAKLKPADKKRIIIRVLCLLVARSEDQQLPPRASGDAASPRSWPLARAVWPTASTDDEAAEAALPSRLAKSG
jgi:hypothetical protein